MIYQTIYQTPPNFSNIILKSDGEYLTELSFILDKDVSLELSNSEAQNLPVFQDTFKWLDFYFKGQIPSFTPKYKISNLTPFRKEVMNILNNISFGETLSYNDIAKQIAKSRGIKQMSAQAVGGAVGSNPICIIIPCHRVIGANKKLVGYAGGLKNKIALLNHESINRKGLK